MTIKERHFIGTFKDKHLIQIIRFDLNDHDRGTQYFRLFEGLYPTKEEVLEARKQANVIHGLPNTRDVTIIYHDAHNAPENDRNGPLVEGGGMHKRRNGKKGPYDWEAL